MKKINIILILGSIILYYNNDNGKIDNNEIDNNEKNDEKTVFASENNFLLVQTGLTLNIMTVTCEDANIGDTVTLNGVEYTKRRKTFT